MKVAVERQRCQGTGICVAVAPDLFAIDAQGAAVALTGDVAPELEGDAHDAVMSCPMAALSVLDDDGT